MTGNENLREINCSISNLSGGSHVQHLENVAIKSCLFVVRINVCVLISLTEIPVFFNKYLC